MSGPLPSVIYVLNLMSSLGGGNGIPKGKNAPVDLAGLTPSGYAVREGRWEVFKQVFDRGDYSVFDDDAGGSWGEEEGEEDEGFGVSAGWFECKGKRDSQEDEFLLGLDSGRVVVGVFDGHGGKDASKYVREEVGRTVGEGGEITVEGLLKIDEDGKGKGIKGGSTGCIVEVREGEIKGDVKVKCWNVGDSRAIAVVVGEDGEIRGEELSKVRRFGGFRNWKRGGGNCLYLFVKLTNRRQTTRRTTNRQTQ